MSFKPYDIDCEPESPELLAVAEKELRETPELREKAIAELRDLLHAATDLHYADDDDFLLIFLRPCHFYADSALKLVSIVHIISQIHFKYFNILINIKNVMIVMNYFLFNCVKYKVLSNVFNPGFS